MARKREPLGGRPAIVFRTRGFAITAEMKDFFLDRPLVRKAIGEANATVMESMGRTVVDAAKRGMRGPFKAKTKPRKPGSYLRPRETDPQQRIRQVWYAYDDKNNQGIVGFRHFRGGRSSVPAVHEHAQTITIKKKFAKNRGRKLRGKAKRAFKKKFKPGQGVPRVGGFRVTRERKTMPQRPTMQLALAKKKDTLAKLWKGAVNRYARGKRS